MPSLRRLFQRGAFNLLYRLGRWIYDPLTEMLFDGEWDRWRRSTVPLIETGPVLDIGCGTGALIEAMTEHGLRVVGLERASSMLAVAARRALPDNSLVQGDSLLLPFKDGVFHACVATFPAAFIQQPQTVNEIYRVLADGGRFVVLLGGALNHDSWRRRVTAVLLSIFYGRRDPTSPEIGWAPLHTGMPGSWQTVRTDRGAAFIWLATKSTQAVTHPRTRAGL